MIKFLGCYNVWSKSLSYMHILQSYPIREHPVWKYFLFKSFFMYSFIFNNMLPQTVSNLYWWTFLTILYYSRDRPSGCLRSASCSSCACMVQDPAFNPLSSSQQQPTGFASMNIPIPVSINVWEKHITHKNTLFNKVLCSNLNQAVFYTICLWKFYLGKE